MSCVRLLGRHVLESMLLIFTPSSLMQQQNKAAFMAGANLMKRFWYKFTHAFL